MPSKYFSDHYQKAVESNLIESLYNEAIYIQGFSAYYIPNSSIKYDLLYGDNPLKRFTTSYKMDTYLTNSDYGDTNDFFSKFGLEIRNNIKIQISTKEFLKRTNNLYSRPEEGALIFIPFLRNSGELFEIQFVNSTKDLNVLARMNPFFYELSLEPFKYSDESINTGINMIDNVELQNSFDIKLALGIGIGDYILNEIVYQGTSNNYIATGTVSAWNSTSSILRVISTSGAFSNTVSTNIVGTTSGATYPLLLHNERYEDTRYDNDIIHDESTNFVVPHDGNPFGGLSQY